jgi:hypothetical protein
LKADDENAGAKHHAISPSRSAGSELKANEPQTVTGGILVSLGRNAESELKEGRAGMRGGGRKAVSLGRDTESQLKNDSDYAD